MAASRSRLRHAVEDRDFERFAEAMARRRPTPAAAEVVASGLFTQFMPSAFRSRALALLLESGLSPDAAPSVLVESRHVHAERVPESASLRLTPPSAFPGQVDMGLPLATRAALMDPQALDLLLAAGANPRVGAPAGRGHAGTFGSAWSVVGALWGSDQARAVFDRLHAADPEPWAPTDGVAADVLGALVYPGLVRPTPAAACSVVQVRECLALLASHLPEMGRAQWAEAFAAWPWPEIRNPTRRAGRQRLAILAQALPPAVLAGLFDAAHAAGMDLRGLALEQDLAGDTGLWDTLQRHASVLGLASRPVWARLERFTHDRPLEEGRRVVLEVDALGYLVLAARWPPLTPEVARRANAWVRRAGRAPGDLLEGQTLAQWRLESQSNHAAPLAWLVQDAAWWAANPLTGQTPFHRARRLQWLLRDRQVLAPRLDWMAVDHAGQQAGACALAWQCRTPALAKAAVELLEKDFLVASGHCRGLPASAWVAPFPDLRRAFDASCARHGIKGQRAARTPWRLHSAVLGMSVPVVRSVLDRAGPAQAQALRHAVDPLGRTPLSCWASLSVPEGVSTIRARLEALFDLLTPPGTALFVPGQPEHPYHALMGQRAHLSRGSSPSWPVAAVDRLATDFGQRLEDPSFRETHLSLLVQRWNENPHWVSWPEVWRALRPGSVAQGAFLQGLAESWGGSGHDAQPSSMRRSLTAVLGQWERAGLGLELAAWDLPALLKGYERLAAQANGTLADLLPEQLFNVLFATRLERDLPDSPEAPALRLRF